MAGLHSGRRPEHPPGECREGGELFPERASRRASRRQARASPHLSPSPLCDESESFQTAKNVLCGGGGRIFCGLERFTRAGKPPGVGEGEGFRSSDPEPFGACPGRGGPWSERACRGCRDGRPGCCGGDGVAIRRRTGPCVDRVTESCTCHRKRRWRMRVSSAQTMTGAHVKCQDGACRMSSCARWRRGTVRLTPPRRARRGARQRRLPGAARGRRPSWSTGCRRGRRRAVARPASPPRVR
jgi:hypothetical protein